MENNFRILHRYRIKFLHFTGKYLNKYWPKKPIDPIFIVGAPRSGTTILGECLGSAKSILYLNEPRYIWVNIDPKLDIWAYRHPINYGKLVWNANDHISYQGDRLLRWFNYELSLSRGSSIIEKTPLNVFRIDWLHEIFPGAKFIHMIRHGKDVALSAKEQYSRWFPEGYWENSRHFKIFLEYAKGKIMLEKRLEYLDKADNYGRGLFVWLCCVTEGIRAGEKLGDEKYLEIKYEDFVSYPEITLDKVFSFIGKPLADNSMDFAKRKLHRRSLSKKDPNPVLTKAMVGYLLKELSYKF